MQLFQRLNCECVLFMAETDENVVEDSSLSVAALSRSIEYKMKWNKWRMKKKPLLSFSRAGGRATDRTDAVAGISFRLQLHFQPQFTNIADVCRHRSWSYWLPL